MTRRSLLTLTLVTAALYSEATPASASAAAQRATSAPTMNELMALDKQANEAYVKGDAKAFEALLSDRFVMREGAQRIDKAALVKMIAGLECEVGAWNLAEPWMARIDADTYVSSYRATWDGTCSGPDGRSMSIPSPTRTATIWVRSGDKWQAAFHGENPIVDPAEASEAGPAPPAASADRKDEARPSPASTSPNTDALVAIEQSVWEAWMARDAKKLDALTASGLSFIDIFGNYDADKTDTLEAWAGSICEIKSVSVTDGVASALSPTVELLMHKGTADGTCYGQKVPAVHGTSVYVKDGDAWKLAFTMNMLADHGTR